MDEIRLRSIAKINLGLHIVGRLENGYHLLETLFYPVDDLFDDVLVRRVEGGSCSVDMPGFPESVPLEKNLAWKAWRVMHDFAPNKVAGLEIEIQKRIPSGAGLGGGSSNAGVVFLAINQLFELGLTKDELAKLAEPLGADVPFFIYGEPLYATGIGNRFEVVNPTLDGFRLEVRPQPWHSGTPEAYKGLNLDAIKHEVPLKALLALPLNEWKGKVLNDLEDSVFPRLPGIAEAVNKMYTEGAVYAAMTGSGSAVFGWFKNRSEG